MEKVSIEISDGPRYCKGCKSIRPITGSESKTCRLAEIYMSGGPWSDYICLPNRAVFDYEKCRWCLRTFPERMSND